MSLTSHAVSKALPVLRWKRALVLLPLAVLIAACGKRPDQAAGPPGGAPPPAEVGVVTVSRGVVPLQTELPGRLEASRVAQVRARAAGIVQKRLFVEGSDVKAGQPLFTIDSAPYRSALASAQATLARSEANLTQARSQAERYKPLVEANAISKQDYINAVAAQKQGEADVAASRAAVQSAQITLAYASVTAPISGRIGRALVTEGALVGVGDATQLAVIQQINPMYVNFTQSTTEVLRMRKGMASGNLTNPGAAASSKVHILLEDGTEYPEPAKLLFTDLTVDQTSGQITIRAEVPNPQGLLLPGMYVRVRLEQAQASDGMLLPQQAVTRGTQGDSVMVVAPDGKVSPRTVRVGASVNNQWVVLEGLQVGEKVMVDGFQKLRGNAPVKAVPWNPNFASQPAYAPGGAPAGGAAGAAQPASGASGASAAASRPAAAQ
ncbi:efflux RND transporter periplasmic adaptor subunit [soil metagenome]